MKLAMLPIGNPAKILNPDKLEKAIKNALNETALAVKVDFNVTTQTWTNRPKFEIKSNGDWERVIYTQSEIYGYVDKGTRPHRIEPRNASRLAFQSGYTAKTTPRVIASRQGGKSGNVVYSYGVNHPGFEGREFSDTIGNKWAKEWPRQLDRAIAAVL